MAGDESEHAHLCALDALRAQAQRVAAADRPPFFADTAALARAANIGPLPLPLPVRTPAVAEPAAPGWPAAPAFPESLAGVVAAVLRSPNLESSRYLCQLAARLPGVDRQRRCILDAALRASVVHWAGRLIDDTSARTSQLCVRGLYDLLDEAAQIRTVVEAEAWLTALGHHRLRFPEQTAALRERLRCRRAELSSRPAARGRRVRALGPRSYRPLIVEQSRWLHGLPADPRFPVGWLESLPQPLRGMIEYWALRNPLPCPQPPTAGIGDDPATWIHPALNDAAWEEGVARDWQQAGVPVVDTVPAFALDRFADRPPASPASLAPTPTPTPAPAVAAAAAAAGAQEWSRLQARAWGMGELLAGQKQYERGQALSSSQRPDFLPLPVSVCSVLDLAMGLLIRDVATLTFFRRALVVAEASSGGFQSPQCPPTLRAIGPQLLQFSTAQARQEALPWLLLHHLADRSRAAGLPPGQVSLGVANELGGGREPFDGLYVELAPDRDPARNQARVLFGGLLENRVIRELRRVDPALLACVSPRDRIGLPAVDALIARSRARQPLRGYNLIGIQHLLDDNAAMLSQLGELGAGVSRAGERDPGAVHLLGVPYSTNERAVQHLRAAGFDVDTSVRKDLDFGTGRAVSVCNLIRKALADHERNGLPILALDDGGHIASTLHRRFPEHAHKFVIVEQTTRGITTAERHVLRCPVINVARSASKRLELPGVKAAIQREIRSRLEPFFDDGFRPGQPAIVLGFGWIGEVVTEVLQEMGRRVVVVDPSAEARRRAERVAGAETRARVDRRLLRGAAIIAGCSGFQSLSRGHLQCLDGQVLFSTSSARVEFAMPDGDLAIHHDVLVTGEGNYLVLGAGFPINFSGKGEVGNPRYLQYTCASMLHGLLQAAAIAGQGARGIVPLDRERAREIVAMAARAGDVMRPEEAATWLPP